MAGQTRPLKPVKPGTGKGRPTRPVKGANFQTKSQRKQVRKGLVRAAIHNKVADIKNDQQEKIEFYRNLRHLKLRRRKIAQEFQVLESLLDSLSGELNRTWARRQHEYDHDRFSEANQLIDRAWRAVAIAGEEFHSFSRRKVYYTQAVAA